MLGPQLLILPFLISCVLSYDGVYQLHYDLEKVEEYFSYFVTTHNKTYYSESEKKLRFEIFKHNLGQINEKNEFHGYIVSGITNYSDLTSEEFIRGHTGFKGTDKTASRRSAGGFCTVIDDKTITVGDLPRNFDWRIKNKVTAVKNQKLCGSCWAFAALANIESLHAIKTGELISLSEQQLLECDSGDCSCCGGLPENAFQYLSGVGLATEKEYPYIGDQDNIGKCRDINKPRVFVNGCTNYDFTDEEKLKQVLLENGPAVIGIDATDIMHVNNGNILKKCDLKKGINHAVLLVGYGEENGVAYWIIKNSWGTSFGDKGYAKVKRGINACGMLNSFVSYAKLA